VAEQQPSAAAEPDLQHCCEDVASTIRKRAILGNLQPVELNHGVGLVKPFFDTSQERLSNFLQAKWANSYQEQLANSGGSLRHAADDLSQLT
jgi:hypothetical protein